MFPLATASNSNGKYVISLGNEEDELIITVSLNDGQQQQRYRFRNASDGFIVTQDYEVTRAPFLFDFVNDMVDKIKAEEFMFGNH